MQTKSCIRVYGAANSRLILHEGIERKRFMFRCIENGKLYVPCEYELQEYMEMPQKNRGSDYER